MPFSEETLTRLKADAAEITGRYPRARSAVLPLLYLVQSEESYISDEGIAFCAEVLGISMVSNPAAGLTDVPIDHQGVLAATGASAAQVGVLLSELLHRL